MGRKKKGRGKRGRKKGGEKVSLLTGNLNTFYVHGTILKISTPIIIVVVIIFAFPGSCLLTDGGVSTNPHFLFFFLRCFNTEPFG